MTEKEYREHPSISRSSLWNLRKSPEYFRYVMDNPPSPTPALLFGQVFHKLALEPADFYLDFAVAPNVNRRTRDGKEQYERFIEDNIGKTVVDSDSFSKAREMVLSMKSAPFVDRLLSGDHEVPFFWIDDLTGEECKARADIITTIADKPIIVDLKTTTDASSDAFMRDAIKHGYDFQAAMYSEGYKARHGVCPAFVFIAVEKEPPYSVNILQADPLFIRRGYDIYRELLGVYHECKSSGNWYGYLGKYETINSLQLPAWLAKEIE